MSQSLYTLSNQVFQATFDSQGNLHSLQGILGKDTLFSQREIPDGHLLRWSLWRSDTRINPFTWELEKIKFTESSLQLQGIMAGVSIRLEIFLNRIGINLTLTLENHQLNPLHAIDWLLAVPEPFPEDLHFTFPFCAGKMLPVKAINEGDEFILQYPVQASMQWVSACTSDQGIYFGIHDPLPLFKEIYFGRSDHQTFLQWRFPDLDLRPGEKITMPPVIISHHLDGWQGGAKIYQAWAKNYVKAPKIPTWIEANPTWAWIGLKGQHAQKPWHTLNYVEEISRVVSKAGINLVQLTAYTEDGHDTLYPDYVPGKSLGGERELKQVVKQIHNNNKRISIYVNGRVVDPASSLTSDQREEWAVRASQNAGPYQERYGSVTFDVMCPGAPGWRALFLKRLEYLVDQFDIDGIYIDQVCGCRSLPCYANNHDHAKPNLAWSSYKTFLEEIRNLLKKKKPDLFLATEGVNDILGGYFDLMQAHQDWQGQLKNKGEPLHELYRTCFPEHLLASGCITQEPDRDYYLKITHLSGTGADFGVWDWYELPDTFFKQILFVLERYQKGSKIFNSTSPIPLACQPSGLFANAFYSPDSILVQCAWLSGKRPRNDENVFSFRIQIPENKEVVGMKAFSQDGIIPVKWNFKGDSVFIKLKPIDIASIEITLENL